VPRIVITNSTSGLR